MAKTEIKYHIIKVLEISGSLPAFIFGGFRPATELLACSVI